MDVFPAVLVGGHTFRHGRLVLLQNTVNQVTHEKLRVPSVAAVLLLKFSLAGYRPAFKRLPRHITSVNSENNNSHDPLLPTSFVYNCRVCVCVCGVCLPENKMSLSDSFIPFHVRFAFSLLS